MKLFNILSNSSAALAIALSKFDHEARELPPFRLFFYRYQAANCTGDPIGHEQVIERDTCYTSDEAFTSYVGRSSMDNGHLAWQYGSCMTAYFRAPNCTGKYLGYDYNVNLPETNGCATPDEHAPGVLPTGWDGDPEGWNNMHSMSLFCHPRA